MLPSELNDLLRQTSRSFYLTLRVLPAPVRTPISLAYLLARTSDTIADTGIVPVAQRLAALEEFRRRIGGVRAAPVEFGALAQSQGLAAERVLLERSEASIVCLRALEAADRARVVEVLDIILGGQALDLQRFAPASVQEIVALATEAELDDYTFRVAGCVGRFWTQVCRAHLFPDVQLDEAQLLADAERFGKGLQLVNILRDLAADLRQGRCYLPASGLAALGSTPADLLRPESEGRARPLINDWLDRAAEYLAAGWRYTNALPRGQMRVRLACAWPILIGARTLARLRCEPVLDPQRRVKVTRAEVRRIMFGSLLRYPFPAAWARQFPAPRV